MFGTKKSKKEKSLEAEVKVKETSTKSTSESKYKFVEHENGQTPSDGQVELYGLDKNKKYILKLK